VSEQYEIDIEALSRTWMHSHEEDQDDRIIFRPAEKKLPPARGRTGISLSADGTTEHIGTAPDDRPQLSPGTWTLEGRVLTLHVSGGEETYEILSVDDQQLVLRRT
jgi:hypothetical protein